MTNGPNLRTVYVIPYDPAEVQTIETVNVADANTNPGYFVPCIQSSSLPPAHEFPIVMASGNVNVEVAGFNTLYIPNYVGPTGTTGPTGFNPVDLITGNGGFWRADEGVSGSAPVTTWADQSSFANDLSQNGAAGNPTFSATGFNAAFPGIVFAQSGQSSLVSAGLSRTTTTLSMFLLVQTAHNPTPDNRLALYWNGNTFDSGSNATAIMLYGDGAGEGFYNYNGGVVGNGGGKTASNAGTYLVGVVYDGVNANTWLNGAVQGAASPDTNTLGTVGDFLHFVLGISASMSAGGSANTPAFTAACFGVTEKVMDATDWANLKDWCNTNWGTAF